jgi:hypothetical protein
MMKMKLIRRQGVYCLVSIGRTTKWIDKDAYEILKKAYKGLPAVERGLAGASIPQFTRDAAGTDATV